MDWKTDLDPILQEYLNDLLKEVVKYRKAYSKSRDVGKSQIWVALALLYREIGLIKSEIEEIRASLKDEKKSKKLEKVLKKF